MELDVNWYAVVVFLSHTRTLSACSVFYRQRKTVFLLYIYLERRKPEVRVQREARGKSRPKRLVEASGY